MWTNAYLARKRPKMVEMLIKKKSVNISFALQTVKLVPPAVTL